MTDSVGEDIDGDSVLAPAAVLTDVGRVDRMGLRSARRTTPLVRRARALDAEGRIAARILRSSGVVVKLWEAEGLRGPGAGHPKQAHAVGSVGKDNDQAFCKLVSRPRVGRAEGAERMDCEDAFAKVFACEGGPEVSAGRARLGAVECRDAEDGLSANEFDALRDAHLATFVFNGEEARSEGVGPRSSEVVFESWWAFEGKGEARRSGTGFSEEAAWALRVYGGSRKHGSQ